MTSSIVIVDNEPDLLVTYERFLRGCGFKILAARSREEAFPHLASDGVALVVTEARLPDGDGLELIRIARGKQPPASGIVVTAFPSRVESRRAREVGAAAYLAKPFSGRELIAVVERQLAVWRGARCRLTAGELPFPGARGADSTGSL